MEKDNTEIIKIKGRLVRIMYPKPPLKIEETQTCFGITCWEVLEGVDKVNANYRGEITITGKFEGGIKYYTDYNILVKEVEHETYGLQYQVQYYSEIVDFSTVSNQRGFLKKILTDNLIDNLFNTYENPLEIISSGDKEALMKVKGIGETRADQILNKFEEIKDYTPVYAELDKLGLSNNFINKMITFYKDPGTVIKVATKTPYRMIRDIDGVSFLTADKVALNGGLPFNSVERIKQFILYHLKTQGNEGHSYVTSKQLTENIYNTLGSKEELIEYYSDDKTDNNINKAIKELIDLKLIQIDKDESGTRRVYLLKFYNLEKEIAYHLKRIRDGKNNFFFEDAEEKIKRAEEEQGFEFTDEQKRGILEGLDNNLYIITGAGGCGKTSVLTGILSVLDNYTFAQTALSGQAAARMQEITGSQGKTIHRLLGYNPNSGFTYNEDNPLKYDVIVLDEVSLVGGEIFLDLLRAIPTGSKLLMLGDAGQLEAVGMLNLAADMIKSGQIKKIELTKVHRQAQKSGILTTAYDVRNGVQLIQEYDYEGTNVRGIMKDMILEVTTDRERDSDLVISYFKKYYNSKLINKDIMQIQVIAPVKERGECCVLKLNKRIQDLVNPKTKDTVSLPINKRKSDDGEDRSFDIRVGDKVMCLKNNYKTLASVEDEITTAIYNGWIGKVLNINETYITVNFPLAFYDKVYIPTEELGRYITLGYCSTVHRLQGSGFPVVIGAIDYSAPPQMLTKQLVYTLITRAKKICVLVAQNTALRRAIATNFVSKKRTFLPELLEKDVEELHG